MVTILKKVPVPPWQAEATIQSPAGTARILKDRVVPGGGWHHVMFQGEGESKPKPTVVAYCPGCGLEGYLFDHTINPDGRVTPSLDCQRCGCKFHDDVVLENYEP